MSPRHSSRILKQSGQLIVAQEMIRTGARGYVDGMDVTFLTSLLFRCVSALLGGMVIGLPLVLNFGSLEIKAKIAVEFLNRVYILRY